MKQPTMINISDAGTDVQSADITPMLDWLVVPLVPGTKQAKGRWNRKLWETHPEQTVVMPLRKLMQSPEYAPYDIGVLIGYNDQVLLDADVSSVLRAEQNSAGFFEVDGPANLLGWLRENGVPFPPTWHDLSPGDPGRHTPGEHWLPKQNPEARISGHWYIAPNVEVKTSGIMRIGLHDGQLSTPVRIATPEVIPEELARALSDGKIKRSAAYGEHSALGDGQHPTLFRLACDLWKRGIPRAEALTAWRAAADELPLADSSWPWVDSDFSSMWEWAEENIDTLTDTQRKWAQNYRVSTPKLPFVKYDGRGENISRLTGDERWRKFEELSYLEGDRHPLARDWHLDRDLQDKYVNVLLPLAECSVVKTDDPVWKRFTAEEIEKLSRTHHRIQELNGEVVFIGVLSGKSASIYPEDVTPGTRNIPAERSRHIVRFITMLAAARQEGLSSRQIARIINHNRELFGLQEHRFISDDRVRQLRADIGQRRENAVIRGHTYLIRHHYGSLPDVYAFDLPAFEESAAYLGIEVNTKQNGTYSVNNHTSRDLDLLAGTVKATHKRYWKRAFRQMASARSLSASSRVRGAPLISL